MEMRNRASSLNHLYDWSIGVLRPGKLGPRNKVIQGILQNKKLGGNGVLAYSDLHNLHISAGGVLPRKGTWLYFGPDSRLDTDYMGRPCFLAFGVMSGKYVECGAHVVRNVVSWGIISNPQGSVQIPLIISEAG